MFDANFLPLQTGGCRNSIGRNTQQISWREEKVSENPFSHLKIQLTHGAVHSETDTLRGHRNLVSACHRALTTVGLTHTHIYAHLDHPSLPSDYHQLPQPPLLPLSIPPAHSNDSPFFLCSPTFIHSPRSAPLPPSVSPRQASTFCYRCLLSHFFSHHILS